MPESAVTFVFVYLCVVVFAMVGLLAYVYRSLASGTTGVDLSTSETTTLSASKQLADAEERVLGRGATWAVPRPLGSRRATTTSREPKARDHGASESVGSTGAVARTNEEANVSRTNFEEGDEAGRTTTVAATPDDERRSLELVLLAAPGNDESCGDRELKGDGHLVRRGLRRRVG